MTILYVDTQGAVVQQEGERLIVAKNDRVTRRRIVLHAEPIHNVDQLVLCGNVQLTTQAAALLLHHRIDVVYLSSTGRYRGRLGRDGSRSARLRLRQLSVSQDQNQTLAIAGQIVQAKLAQQRELLVSLTEKVSPPILAAAQQAGQSIEQLRRTCSLSPNLETLRGFEGKAAAHYFGVLRLLLDSTWGFSGRAYHPAPDPVNALLSFGYALLMKDIERVTILTGLDPYLGFLHVPEENRPSLVLDLMEEFRPLWVDRAMIELVLGGRLKASDFTFTGRPERPVELGSRLMPLVIDAYESRGDVMILHGPSQTHQRLRNCLELQTRLMEHVILETHPSYQGMAL